MQNTPDIDPEQIKMLEIWALRYKRNSNMMYAFAAIMLINSAISVHINEPKWLFICGSLGIMDCFLADKARKNYKRVRNILNETKNKSR